MSPRYRKTSMALFVAVSVGIPMVASGSTQAQEAPIPSAPEIVDITQAEILNGVSQDGSARVAAEDFVDDMAHQGRLIDQQMVTSAVVGENQFAWESGSEITLARRATTVESETQSDGSVVSGEVDEMALFTDESETPVGGHEDERVDGPTRGIGMEGSSFNLGGVKSKTGGCQTWTVQSQKLTACYEKLVPVNDYSKTRDYYVYNRWATAEGQQIRWDTDWQVVKLDIRSRPRRGYESRIISLNNYYPRDQTQMCNAGGSIGLSYSGISLTLPLSDCHGKTPLVDANSKTLGVVFDDGFWFSQRVRSAEFSMEVGAPQNGKIPLFGDYNYAKFCRDTLLTCKGTLGSDGW